MHFED